MLVEVKKLKVGRFTATMEYAATGLILEVWKREGNAAKIVEYYEFHDKSYDNDAWLAVKGLTMVLSEIDKHRVLLDSMNEVL
jgi:hypothetical protein